MKNPRTWRTWLSLLLLSFVSGIWAGLAFGQIKRIPPPHFISVAEQPDSPVVLTLLEGFEPSPNWNPVNYSVQNVSKKPIRSLVITGFPKDPNHSFGVGGLKPGASRSLSYGNISARKNDETFTLVVDYVLFTDGTHWGADKAKESEFIHGFLDGQKRIYQDIKKLIEANDEEALTAFLVTPRNIPELSPPGGRSRRDWGWAHGYTYWYHTLGFDFRGRGDLKGILSKVADLERELGLETQKSAGVRRISRAFIFNEPIKLIRLQLARREIAFDEDYVAATDWLKGLSIKIHNDSKRTIVHVLLSLDFVETAMSGNPMIYHLRYGTHPDFPITYRPGENAVLPDQTFEIGLDEKQFVSLKRFLDTRHPFDRLTRVNVSIVSVVFEDGATWSGGQYQKRDPNDPKRWIPID